MVNGWYANKHTQVGEIVCTLQQLNVPQCSSIGVGKSHWIKESDHTEMCILYEAKCPRMYITSDVVHIKANMSYPKLEITLHLNGKVTYQESLV